jgi:hypothetical protein
MMILLALSSSVLSGPATAQQAPPGLAALFACRTIGDDKRRLECLDRETAALDTASREKSIVVLDRAEVRRTKRSLFGFSLPNLKLFGGGSNDNEMREAEESRRLETTITSIGRTAEGVQFTVEDGAMWTQTDDRSLMIGRIKPGGRVVIQRAAMGSYFAIFPGQPGVRVRRTR